MKTVHQPYEQFVKWVQADMKNARVSVNRKVFSVVLWCLIIPAILSLVLHGLRKFQVIQTLRYADAILFFPPFIFVIFSLWPTLRDLPHVFKIGGLGSILEESSREVEWRETTARRIESEIHLSSREWKLIEFHLEQDLARIRTQNRYMSVLIAVVFLFMYQFLDLGGGVAEESHLSGGMSGLAEWADHFSQWGSQVLTVIQFSCLFYLSGMQLQKHLVRYTGCVKRLAYFDAEA